MSKKVKFFVIILVIIKCMHLTFWTFPIVSAMAIGFVEGLTSTDSDNIVEQESTELLEEETTEWQCKHQYETIFYEATYSTNAYYEYFCLYCDETKIKNINNSKITPVSFEGKGYEKNYVDGVTLYFNIHNNTDKIIKYVEFEIIFYNAVGDRIYNSINYSNKHDCWKMTGPLNPGEAIEFNPTGFYNTDFKGQYAISDVTVIFMDNTKIKITDRNYDMSTLYH